MFNRTMVWFLGAGLLAGAVFAAEPQKLPGENPNPIHMVRPSAQPLSAISSGSNPNRTTPGKKVVKYSDGPCVCLINESTSNPAPAVAGPIINNNLGPCLSASPPANRARVTISMVNGKKVKPDSSWL